MVLIPRLECHSPFTLPVMIRMSLPCETGLKGWRGFYRSVVFCQRLVYQQSAQSLNALKTRHTVAAVAFSLISLTLFHRSHSLKSLLRTMATSVIFTPSITVSLTSLSSIGELQSFAFVLLVGHLLS
jgi:hypothetical protein